MKNKKDELQHYGTPRHSGRYPWGSGGDPYQNSMNFRAHVADLRRSGLSDTKIAKGLGMTTSEFRNQVSISKTVVREPDVARALALKDKGYSNVAIGKKMGINESTVRSLLDPVTRERSNMAKNTANILKEGVDKNGLIDVGVGVERHLGISRVKLKTSLALLEDEGYTIHYVNVEQLGTGKLTRMMVLAPPGTPYAEVYKNKDNIKLINDKKTDDGGRSYYGLEPIQMINGKRVLIRYAEEGGKDKDGVIELRPGLQELSLGNAQYAQVRIGVDGTHYLKGMALYGDKNMPPGVDIIFNTNKPKGTDPKKVMKELSNDKDNRFGAVIKREEELMMAQKYYIDKNGKKKLSPINIVNEEGDWSTWSKNLSSQMLSKQNPKLIKKQLGITWDSKMEEYNDIMRLTNPAIKKKLLESFADGADSSSVHLKAAALPRQASHVILPFPKMSEKEVYAPNYRNGEKVALIRYPHGGTFEIPVLTVNNKQSFVSRILKNAKDAIGISPRVAERLSGADFDGDSVLVIPTNGKTIKTTSPLKGLQNFDPQHAYPAVKNMKTMKNTQTEMGKISNLITDMTIKGANESEIARAVRHSMVVIDAEKHNLNYTKSFDDNNISGLKQKYQGGSTKGASTLISKASSQARVAERKDLVKIDKKTGEKIYTDTGNSYISKAGKLVTSVTKSTKMAETKDARTLSSGTVVENIYADHANKLKALANKARKESISVKPITYSASAKKVYDNEVKSLSSKLNVALKNAPLERQAQVVGNKVVQIKKKSNPDMDKATLKRIKGQALVEARSRVGAGKQQIDITQKEWQAIQAGAVSNTTLTKILNNTNLDNIKALATPRTTKAVSSAKISRAKSLLSMGYTQAEVADAVGISVSTLSKELMN